jgi:hypothetical protein
MQVLIQFYSCKIRRRASLPRRNSRRVQQVGILQIRAGQVRAVFVCADDLSTAGMAESHDRGGTKMSGHVTVLATLHEHQGAQGRSGNVEDPIYVKLLDQLLIAEGFDFIFEEAAGWGPTIAEKFSRSRLEPNRYLDVDPPARDRAKFGIPPVSNESYMVGSPPEAAFAHWQFLEVHMLREELWIQRMQAQEFKKALMICGLVHGLSLAFRLRAANFSVSAIQYANWQRSRIRGANADDLRIFP